MAYNPRSLNNLRPPWKPGESGNPGGRPKGSLTRELIGHVLLKDFEKHGEAAIEQLRKESPALYLAAILKYCQIGAGFPDPGGGDDELITTPEERMARILALSAKLGIRIEVDDRRVVPFERAALEAPESEG